MMTLIEQRLSHRPFTGDSVEIDVNDLAYDDNRLPFTGRKTGPGFCIPGFWTKLGTAH
jgi:hypothetical protein